MFKIHVLKLLIMIVRFEMEAKRERSGTEYAFQKENGSIDKVQDYIKKEAHSIAAEKVEKELSKLI